MNKNCCLTQLERLYSKVCVYSMLFTDRRVLTRISDVMNVRLTGPFAFRNAPLFAALRAVGLSGCFPRGENGRTIDVE